MTVTRCLLPFAHQFTPDREVMRDRYRALPETCPFDDCTAESCRKVCGEWAAMQFRILGAREVA